jgi:hypothetical protein
MQRLHWIEPEWQAGWGLGFRVLRLRDRTFIGHGGGVPGFRTELRIRPADRLAAIVFINAGDGETWPYADKALDWVGSAIAGVTQPSSRTPDPGWQRYVGCYRNYWGDLQVIGEHTFRVETKDGYGLPGELAVFDVDASGRPTRVRLGELHGTDRDLGGWLIGRLAFRRRPA